MFTKDYTQIIFFFLQELHYIFNNQYQVSVLYATYLAIGQKENVIKLLLSLRTKIILI